MGTPASTASTNGTSTATRPGSAVPRPGSTVPRPGSTVSRPSSMLPNKPMMHPGQGQVPVKPQQVDPPTTTMRAGTPMNVDQIQQRVKKREREDGNIIGMTVVGAVNGVAPHSGVLPTGLAAAQAQAQAPTTNGYVNGNGIGPKTVANAKAGTAGVRPRPTKRQKIVSCSFFVLLFLILQASFSRRMPKDRPEMLQRLCNSQHRKASEITLSSFSLQVSSSSSSSLSLHL